MTTENVSFTNPLGEKLSGRIELPPDRKPHNFAIFAHCFTCSKNFNTVVNISRELAQAGFGVLRFDFTGLGQSEGDFADTNFSGNVDDLIAAAKFIEEKYMAPTLLVGHSLGGAAVLYAAAKLPKVKAVATIAAPSDPAHVKRLLKDSESDILKKGKATVQLEGRNFTIKKQFLDDLEGKYLPNVVRDFRKALLVFHSPQDMLVGINNAEEIFTAARHPKSFVSLDGADHLLTRDSDARYVGRVIGQWATRYVDIPTKKELDVNNKIAVSLDQADNYTAQMKLGDHYLLGDEPTEVGGNNYGSSPYDYLAGSLALCKALTAQMYVRRKGWNMKNITVTANHSKTHAADCMNCDQPASKIDLFQCEVKVSGDLTPEQKNRILEIADRCPVHRTLTGDIKIESKLVDEI